MLIEQCPFTSKHVLWSVKLVSCKCNSAPIDLTSAGADNHSTASVGSVGAGLKELSSVSLWLLIHLTQSWANFAHKAKSYTALYLVLVHYWFDSQFA